MRTRNRIAVVLAVIAVALAIIDGAAHAATSTQSGGPQPTSDQPASNVYMSLGHAYYDPTTYVPFGPLVSSTEAWTVENNTPVACDTSVCGGIVIRKVNGIRKAFVSLVDNEQVQFGSFGYHAADGSTSGGTTWTGRRGLRLQYWGYNNFGDYVHFKLDWAFASVYNSDYPEPHYGEPCPDDSVPCTPPAG